MTATSHREITATRFGKAGALLQSLVPRAQAFSFYDQSRECVWSSAGSDDFEVDTFVSEISNSDLAVLAETRDVLRRTLTSGRTVLLLPVYTDAFDYVGVLVALFTRNAGKSASFDPNILKGILEPALDVIGESLHVGAEKLALERRAADVQGELAVVYEVDERIHGVAGRHSSLAQLVGRSGRYLRINYSVLLIPSKRIRISATHSSWKSVDRKMLDRYLIEQLMPKLEGQRQPVVFEIPATDGTGNGFEALLCPVLDNQGNVEGMLAQLGRVDGEKFRENDLRFMSHIGRKVEYVIEQSFDATTGLMNRAGFEAQLQESYNTLTDDAEHTHAIIYFDLDNLQLVNDTFGRKAGDEVIMRFASLLGADLPSSGVLSRLTGDDFCLLLTNANSGDAHEYASRVRDMMSELRYLEGDKSLQVTMSVGITEFNRHNTDMGAVLTTARMACEAAKGHGRDRIEMFDEGNRSAVRRFDDMQLVASIQQALDGDNFELVAQPIRQLRGDTAPRFEILLRMSDGEGGHVPTSAFFSAAERYKMMPQIDRWVVSKTISQLDQHTAELQKMGARFAVNLSGQSLGDDDFLAFVEEELDNSTLPPTALCFEITESAAVSNVAKAQHLIDSLSQHGCAISLDDFGAGLSSFAYLKNFRVDTLKIDGGFIRDLTTNRISESMVAAITQVAKVLGLETVAEYVESEPTRERLRKMNVDYAQGHLIGEPEPLDTVLAELTAAKTAGAEA